MFLPHLTTLGFLKAGSGSKQELEKHSSENKRNKIEEQ